MIDKKQENDKSLKIPEFSFGTKTTWIRSLPKSSISNIPKNIKTLYQLKKYLKK